MTINYIPFRVIPKDYSAQLEKVKAQMGRSYKGHPDHDPLEHPWQYEPWRIDRIEADRKQH